jgi:transposase
MPGPPPAYRPDFSPEFLNQARSLAGRRTVRYQLRQRAELALLLHDQPTLSNPEAAARVRLHPNSVRTWRKRWATGDLSLQDEPGRGRKAEFSPPR